MTRYGPSIISRMARLAYATTTCSDSGKVDNCFDRAVIRSTIRRAYRADRGDPVKCDPSPQSLHRLLGDFDFSRDDLSR